MTAEENFKATGFVLPPAPKPIGIYKTSIIIGNLLYVSGHGPFREDGTLIRGKVGEDISMDDGKLAARQVGLSILATLKDHLGSLDKVKRVVKVLGMVGCIPSFEKQPYVINGCSELFAAVWGTDMGIGVRSAVGMGSLPDNIPVEIEAVFELAD